MIYCPKCGTANLEDSKFCTQCGTALEPETGRRCPMCGALNPPGNVFCDECQARLVPVVARPTGPLEMPAPFKGLSLPTKPLEEPEAEAPAPQPEVPEPTPEPEPAPAPVERELAEDEEPDWLINLRAKYGRGPVEAEMEAEPAWLRELHEPPVEEAEQEAPDWLSELRRRAEEEALAPEEEVAEEEEVPPIAGVTEAVMEREEEEGEEAPPEWLRAIREEVPPEEVAPGVEAEEAVAEEEELPDWIRELSQEAVEEAEEEVAPLAEEEEATLPDWLAAVVPPAEEEEAVLEAEEVSPPAPPAPEVEEKAEEEEKITAEAGEPPDWLQRIAPPEEVPAAEVPPAEEAEAPEWLRTITSAAAEPPPPETEREAPSWLQEISAAGEVPVFEEAEPAAVEEEEAMPSWLQELAPTAEEGPPAVEELLGEEAEEGAIPSWLQEIKDMEPPPLEEPAALVEAPAPPEEAVEEEELEEVPPFTVGVEKLIETPPVPEEAVEAGVEGVVEEELAPPEVEGLAKATIPAWLMALRPAEAEKEPAAPGVEEEAVPVAMETTGLLAGIPGVLPAEPIIGVPHVPRPPAEVTVPGELALEAKLLGEVVAEQRPAGVVLPRERAQRLARQVGRFLLYLALITAVLLPYFFSTGLFDESVPPAPETEDFYRAIENLEPDAVVLVAFDYDPSLAGEMNLQAEALVHHLMRRGLKVMTLSMYPGGQALAEQVLLSAAGLYEYQAGTDYINLGYLPNHPASLRAFAGMNPLVGFSYEGTPVQETLLGQRISSLSDFALIVELAADQQTLRWWVEQVGSQYPNLPLVAGISAGLDPYVRPYYETPGRRQLKGLLVGLPGAAQYEGLTGRVGRALDNLESQGLAHLTIVAAIVVSNVVYFASRFRKGK
ncbi:MAG: zinc ribbon domain-containing protein [Anaerolineae bacterium]|nr:zinc ribbon domain-containing protein [Anaerolineae bacterium]